MAGKDCNCGPGRTTEVPNPHAVEEEPTDPGFGVDAATRAQALLGGRVGDGTTSELLDALCDALTECREENKTLKDEVDTLDEELTQCQDELSEVDDNESDHDDGQDETEMNDGLSTTTEIHPKTMAQALSGKRASTTRSESNVRQDNAVQQSGRGLQRSVQSHDSGGMQSADKLPATGSIVRGRGTGRVPAVQRRSGAEVPAERSERQLSLLRQQSQLPADKQRDLGGFLPRPNHADASVRGHLLASRPPVPRR